MSTEGRHSYLLAAIQGHEGVAARLLERKDVNTDTRNDAGCTPLFYAALNGHEGVVALLLARGDVTLQSLPSKEGYWKTPLSAAIGNRHKKVIALIQKAMKAEDGRAEA